MKNRSAVLLKNLLLSTSGINTLRYEKDSKKKGKVVGGYIGMSILYLMLMAYCILMAIGYGLFGLTQSIPTICALIVSVMEFFFCILKTNGYLFAFKEYDMMMALPFKPSEIAGIRFLYMYVKNLPWVYIISISMMVGYGVFAKPSIIVYVIWLLLTALLPLIPMVVASFIGALIVKIGSAFKYKQLAQTILMFIFVGICMCSRFIIESIFRDNEVKDVLETVSQSVDVTKKLYPPIAWFEASVVDVNFLAFILFTVVSVLIFVAFAWLVGQNYRKVNSLLMSGVSKGNYKMKEQKKKNIVNSIAFKEYRRLVGSTNYIVNMGMGLVLAAILSIAVLFIDLDSIIATITEGAPISKENLLPAIPFIIYFLVGMSSTTSCSLSLEGKNLWILKSLPVKFADVIKGKMLFNMYMQLPFMALASLCVGIKAGANALQIILFLILGFLLCAFSATLGMLCNLGHPKYEWENELEVIKQGASVALYMLPNMLGGMIVVVGAVALGFVLATNLVLLISCLFFAIIDFICYKLVVGKSSKGF